MLPRDQLQRSRKAQGIKDGHHHLYLSQIRIVFAMSKLPETALPTFSISRDRCCIHTHSLLWQVIHPDQMLTKILLNLIPQLISAQMLQSNSESIIGKIRLSDLQTCCLFQRLTHPSYPVLHAHLAMISLAHDIG